MTYRVVQWSTGHVGSTRCGPSSIIPSSSWSGSGSTPTTKVGRDAGELVGRPPTGVLATNDIDALLDLQPDVVCYTATADLRAHRGGRRHRPHPGQRRQRRLELARAAAAPEDRRPVDDRPARGRLQGGRHQLLLQRHRPRLRQRPAPARALGREPTHPLGAGDGDPQLRDLRPGRGPLRHDGLRPGPRLPAAPAPARRALLRVGRGRARHRRGPRRRARRAASRPTSAGRSTSDVEVAGRTVVRRHPGRASASRCRASPTAGR